MVVEEVVLSSSLSFFNFHVHFFFLSKISVMTQCRTYECRFYFNIHMHRSYYHSLNTILTLLYSILQILAAYLGTT